MSFCRTCLLYSTPRCARRALKNACTKMVSYKTCISNLCYKSGRLLVDIMDEATLGAESTYNV
jgi:ribonuclease PH